MGFFSKLSKKNANQTEKVNDTIKTDAKIDTKIETNEGISPEIVAVIAAAINSMMGPTHNLVVRNIVRSNDNSPEWAKASRRDVMASRF